MERDENYVPKTRTELKMAPKTTMKTKDYLEIFEEVCRDDDQLPTAHKLILILESSDPHRYSRSHAHDANHWLELVPHVQHPRLLTVPPRNQRTSFSDCKPDPILHVVLISFFVFHFSTALAPVVASLPQV